MPIDHTRCPFVRNLAFAAMFALSASQVFGGFGSRFGSAVGGVSIDADGVVSQATTDATEMLVKEMEARTQAVEGVLNEATPLRRISLRGLAAEVAAAARENREVSDEVRYLAGLQRVKNIFVYPESNDIVIAGPGEGWVVNARGEVVGKTTGQPVIQLEDLLVALRTVEQARTVGVSCSIDPTEEGTRRMQQLVRKQSRFNPKVLDAIEKVMGPQQITVTGVPETSHAARVLVAADYRMKRIAMNLEQAPVKELPGFLTMLKNSRMKVTNMMPRWWMACDYEPMGRTEDGLGWELRGPGVKVMTEDDFVASDGSRSASERRGSLAQKWADMMTANYEELSKHSGVFGQLRNFMDLCVVAAVIEKNNLIEVAGCDLSTLTRSDSDVVISAWNAPKTVSTQCSFTKRGKEYLVTASGGVQIESWQAAERSQVDTRVAEVRTKAAKSNSNWWQ